MMAGNGEWSHLYTKPCNLCTVPRDGIYKPLTVLISNHLVDQWSVKFQSSNKCKSFDLRTMKLWHCTDVRCFLSASLPSYPIVLDIYPQSRESVCVEGWGEREREREREIERSSEPRRERLIVWENEWLFLHKLYRNLAKVEWRLHLWICRYFFGWLYVFVIQVYKEL